MTFGHEFGQGALVARQRYETYLRDADSYRLAGPKISGASADAVATLGDRVGAMLLAWGCRLCERRGTVTVRIEVERRKPAHPHAA